MTCEKFAGGVGGGCKGERIGRRVRAARDGGVGGGCKGERIGRRVRAARDGGVGGGWKGERIGRRVRAARDGGVGGAVREREQGGESEQQGTGSRHNSKELVWPCGMGGGYIPEAAVHNHLIN